MQLSFLGHWLLGIVKEVRHRVRSESPTGDCDYIRQSSGTSTSKPARFNSTVEPCRKGGALNVAPSELSRCVTFATCCVTFATCVFYSEHVDSSADVLAQAAIFTVASSRSPLASLPCVCFRKSRNDKHSPYYSINVVAERSTSVFGLWKARRHRDPLRAISVKKPCRRLNSWRTPSMICVSR